MESTEDYFIGHDISSFFWGSSFHDKDGTERFDIRVKWWENPICKTYEQMSVVKGIKM